MIKKSFFKERTEAEVRALRCARTINAKDLVQRIGDLNPSDEALLLGFRLTPAKFGTRDEAQASRRNLRHGFYIPLGQPYSVDAAVQNEKIPLQIRQEALARLPRIPQEGNFCLGYSFRPITGPNRTRIYVPFWSIGEGCKLDSYVGQVCDSLPEDFNAGFEVSPYDNAGRVSKEGAKVIVKVPSRTKAHEKYVIRFENVAVKDNAEKKVIAWGTKPSINGGEIMHRVYNFRFREGEDFRNSDFFMIYPHDIAAHQAMIRHYMGQHNLVPLQMSQLAIASKEGAEFYGKVKNNVLIESGRDEKGRVTYRKLHIDEVSMLQARQVGVLGPERTMYWDAERDGRIKDYGWGV